MSRRRLFVTFLVPQPVCADIDVLRTALGDRDVPRIAPHITLLPPHNYDHAEEAALLAAVQNAAASLTPFTCELGPAESFLPENPVLYLEVDEFEWFEPLAESLASAVEGFVLRPDFTPHVTLLRKSDPMHLPALVNAFGFTRFHTTFRTIDVLAHDEDERRWTRVRSFVLGHQLEYRRENDVFTCSLQTPLVAERDVSRGAAPLSAAGEGHLDLVVADSIGERVRVPVLASVDRVAASSPRTSGDASVDDVVLRSLAAINASWCD